MPFRQGEEGRLVGHPDVAGGGQFQPAADGRAVQRRDGRHPPAADLAEHRVPGAGMQEGLLGRARPVLREVEAGAEAGAVAEEDHRPRLGLRAPDRGLQFGQRRLADGVALGRAVQADPGDGAAQLVGDGALLGHPIPPRAPGHDAGAGQAAEPRSS